MPNGSMTLNALMFSSGMPLNDGCAVETSWFHTHHFICGPRPSTIWYRQWKTNATHAAETKTL
ncbi:Uncharacterised protein [Mycobacteroides abscessus subsp. abscessus]|nr:Uncharacterised protein [Mycobacteroides abscessus subsp. abscessus]